MKFLGLWASTSASLLIVRRFPIGLYCGGFLTAIWAGLFVAIARFGAAFALLKLAPFLNFQIFVVWWFLEFLVTTSLALLVSQRLLTHFHLRRGLTTALVVTLCVVLVAAILGSLVEGLFWLLLGLIFVLPMLNAMFPQSRRDWFWY